MANLDRRTFIKYLGRGAAALGAGMGLSLGACNPREAGETAGEVRAHRKEGRQACQGLPHI